MSTEQAGAVVIQVTARDFEQLCENSGNWADLTTQAARFEPLEPGHRPWSRQWQRIYWLGTSYPAVIFARAFLAARGFGYEVLWDAPQPQYGPPFGYVILTDYEGEAR